jgi:hypothetical protein
VLRDLKLTRLPMERSVSMAYSLSLLRWSNYPNGADASVEAHASRDSGVVVVVVVRKLCASRGPAGFIGGSWPSAVLLHGWNHWKGDDLGNNVG